MPASIVWFRNDLRLADNPALTAALRSGRPVVPLYILDEETPGLRAAGAASRWWLHGSLHMLAASLAKLGSRLILRRGPARRVIEEIVGEADAAALYWNRAYDRSGMARDGEIKQTLERRGLVAEGLKGNLLFEPWQARKPDDTPYKVFTAFWRACRALPPPGPLLPAPARLPGPAHWPRSDALDALCLRSSAAADKSDLGSVWAPGEASAIARLATFVDDGLDRYRLTRDLPGTAGTSRLSPHLAFGEIGPRQAWRAATAAGLSASTEKFLAELGWREFAYSLLFHLEDPSGQNMRSEFDSFPWAPGSASLDAWREGRTGYPIVDAGMRELAATGWMHNRVRMIVASFLTKHLLVDWRQGERWFWESLVDADPANNAVGWQWVAGSAADAQPYFRVFNPVLQGEKFDPRGGYVRRWLPELASLPDDAVHRPWTAPRPLYVDRYPPPIVDHAAARQRALEAFRSLKRSA
ncbi:MAG: deoxyribodipyrimidine photo-lyase [Enhydrobacter sp.]|nr:MAG: deoxyribodipyrimidine photo-lyase [Enhydrobacter sp.]